MAPKLERGILIAFEGVDGAGKTTQARDLVERLQAAGFDAFYTKEPTQGPYGQALRQSAIEGRLSVDEELRLFMLDREEHVRDLLQPAVANGRIAVIDRYYFSTVAYQGARGMDVEQLIAANESIAPVPDVLFILDIDPEQGLDRVRSRGSVPDLFERIELLSVSAEIFRHLGGEFVVHIDGSDSISEVGIKVRDALYHGPLRANMDIGDWTHLGSFEAPVDTDMARRIEAIAADMSLTDEERVSAIREAAAG